jgi:hypothetical protein
MCVAVMYTQVNMMFCWICQVNMMFCWICHDYHRGQANFIIIIIFNIYIAQINMLQYAIKCANFSACPVWMHTRSINTTNIIFTHNTNTHKMYSQTQLKKVMNFAFKRRHFNSTHARIIETNIWCRTDFPPKEKSAIEFQWKWTTCPCTYVIFQ